MNVLYSSLVCIQKIPKNLNEEGHLRSVVTLEMQLCGTVMKLGAMLITSHRHSCFEQNYSLYPQSVIT